MTIDKLALGTVQFGIDYGITNKHGRVSQQKADPIIDHYCQSVTAPLLDTAIEYGIAEQVIGRHLANGTAQPGIVTKINCPAENMENEFKASLGQLGVDQVYGLLVHDASVLMGYSGNKILEKLKSFQDRGWVDKIGASVYGGHQIEAFLKFKELNLIQLPFSIFDDRLLTSGILGKLHADGCEVHARSIFLQGIALMPSGHLPDFLSALNPSLEILDKHAIENEMSRLELALSFVLSQPTIDRIVVGVTSLQELEEILNAAKKIAQGQIVDISLKNIPHELLDPRTWNQ